MVRAARLLQEHQKPTHCFDIADFGLEIAFKESVVNIGFYSLTKASFP